MDLCAHAFRVLNFRGWSRSQNYLTVKFSRSAVDPLVVQVG